jgi:membrane-anchored glycerophosphoryl diester phosphodiesterase (GDPDase)
MSAVLQVCASQAYLDEEVDVAAAIRLALPRLPRVIIAAVIKFALMTLFFLLFLFPVLWIVALLFAVTPIIVLENGGVLAAMRRSASLSRKRKWHILNTLGLAAIIYYVLVLGFSAVGAIFGNFVVSTVLGSVVTVLVYPVVAITETLLYYDARIQSEGLDIELMTGALDAVPPATA